MIYSGLLATSFMGTKFFGMERTISGFRRVGKFTRFLPRKEKDPKVIYSRVCRAYSFLPLAVRCLDQAVVTWYAMNAAGHQAEMKIGVTLAPLTSHAWVEVDGEKFIDFEFIEDMQVIANYAAW